MRTFFIALTRNAISLVGAAITTAAALLILTLFAIGLVGHEGGPYIGILAYLILPAIFLVGLALIPVGIVRERRRERAAEARGEPAPTFPVVDLNRKPTRKAVLVFLAMSGVNLVILATATYKGVEVMDSTEFCGQACHTVMDPEFTTYQSSPHARVKCVECHIGPGANWFVKSKLSGAWQVVAVAFDLYPRPIPTPVENLRPARETCEQCHWPTKFVGDRLKVLTHYAEDEQNTELKSVLLLRVGGIQGRKSHGIHWHVDPANRIRYRADATRETIHEVELTLPDGTVKRWLPPQRAANGQAAEQGAAGAPEVEPEWREMDCVDCHNRPTHVYKLPDRSIDEAIAEGRLDRSLPYIRREGLRALEESYASHDEARQAIAERITAFYRENYPELASSDGPRIAEAAGVLGDIYCRNVFPTMNIGWGTYPNHIGHTSFDGCFRCHNDEHATADGETISQDCSTCHSLLAMEEEQPEILGQLQP